MDAYRENDAVGLRKRTRLLGSAGASPAVSGASPETSHDIRYSKRRLPHFDKPWAIYAVTMTTRGRRQLLPEARTIVLDAIIHFHLRRYELFAVCVMPDHVHFLFQPWPKEEARGEQTIFWRLSEVAHSIKSFTGHKINRLVKTTGPVWEEEVFDRYIRSETDLQEKFRYICRNAWDAGIVEQSDDYPWLWTAQDDPGSTPVTGVGESVSLSRTSEKDCFGETPKPTPETGVLPKPVAGDALGRNTTT